MNNEKLIKELYLILKENRLPTEEEKREFYFKVGEGKNLARYNQDEYTFRRLEGMENSMNDKISAYTSAYERGYKKGVAISMVKKLLDVLDIETIAKVTELSIEEVEEIINEM